MDIFLERARQMAQARDLISEEPPYAAATALLAVHSAIAFTDALLFRLTGRAFPMNNHRASVQEVTKRCRAHRLDIKGIAQLSKLISVKTQISYSEHRVTQEAAYKLHIAAGKYEVWVYERLKELQ